jgi:polysaccharide biosynthesis transport protein
MPGDRTQALEQPRLPIGAFWSRVLQRRFAILGLSVTGGLLAALVVRGMGPLYEAQVSLLVGTQRMGSGLAQDPEQGGWAPARDGHASIQTQIALLQSRTLAESVTERLGLWDAAALAPSHLDWMAWVRDFFPGVESRPPPTLEQARAARVAAVRRRLKVEARPDSQVIRLSVTASDPALAARVANAFADAYVEMGRTAGQQPSEDKAAPVKVALAEHHEHGSDGDQLQVLAARLGEARARSDELQEVHDRMQRAGTLSSADLMAHAVLARNLSLQSLKASELQAEREVLELAKRYGPLHPRMVTARSEHDAVRGMLAAEIGQTVAGLAQELDTARAQADKLEADLRALRTETRDKLPRDTEPGPPAQQVQSDAQLNPLRLVRLQDAALEGGRPWVRAQVIDAAQVPLAPIEPGWMRIIGAALLLGLAAGCAWAMLSAYRDPTLARPQDVEEGLQLPMLGAIPLARRYRRKGTPPERLFADAPASGFAEAIRTLRTRILLSSPDASCGLVLVTSSVQGEGKTTVAINLALALGRLGKVLLIDADMRQASVARRLGLPADALGLTDLVAGDADESACIHRIAGAAIEILPAGAVPPDPLEILSSPQCAQALDRLRGRYAQIVVDSAPAQAVSDALLLSRASTAVVLVIRANETPLPLIRATVRHLRQVDAPLIGAVLNADRKPPGPAPSSAPCKPRAADESPCA